MPECNAPLLDDSLVDYWAGDSAPDETEAIEAHLFACEACTARLAQLGSMGAGLAALVRQGRVSGLISRALINRMQRDGVCLRMYTVSPGETVPCAVFPGDDLVVACLRADFTGVGAMNISVTGPATWSTVEFEEVPISPSEGEVFVAFPAAFVRQMPSTRLELRLTSATPEHAVLGDYVLDHSGREPDAR